MGLWVWKHFVQLLGLLMFEYSVISWLRMPYWRRGYRLQQRFSPIGLHSSFSALTLLVASFDR